MLELDACGVGCEVPVCLGVAAVAVTRPGSDLFGEGLLIGDASIQALRSQDGQLGFGEIEPRAVRGRVMPLEPLDQSAGFLWRKCFVKRRRLVCVEIVLNQHDFSRVRKVGV